VAGFVVDDNMPRTTASVLRDAGYEAINVRDVGLRGADDEDVFAFAQSRQAALIMADRDFSSVLTFRPGTHAGIIFVRIPSKVPNEVVNREVVRAIVELGNEELSGAHVVVEVGRTRVRRPSIE